MPNNKNVYPYFVFFKRFEEFLTAAISLKFVNLTTIGPGLVGPLLRLRSLYEHSAQFLSNVHDDHKALKLKLDKITSGIESTKTESKKCVG
jgi:hypothetical protein